MSAKRTLSWDQLFGFSFWRQNQRIGSRHCFITSPTWCSRNILESLSFTTSCTTWTKLLQVSPSANHSLAETEGHGYLTFLLSPVLLSESGERPMWREGAAARHGAHLERVQRVPQCHPQRLHQQEWVPPQQTAGGRTHRAGTTGQTKGIIGLISTEPVHLRFMHFSTPFCLFPL